MLTLFYLLLAADAADWNRLAVERYRAGAYGEAEVFYRRAVEESDRPVDQAKVWSNLGALYKRQARWQEAEDCYRKVVELRARNLGERHADTAVARNNLAEVYRTIGRYEEARPLYEAALRALETTGQMDEARVLNNAAELNRQEGRVGEAARRLRASLAITVRLVGEKDPEVCGGRNNLARVYQSAGNYAEAERLYREVLEACPTFGFAMLNLGRLYREQGRLEEAERWENRALDAAAPGDELFLAAVEHELANLYREMRRPAEAEWRYARTLELQGRLLPAWHPERIATLFDYARLKRLKGEKKEAGGLEAEAKRRLPGRRATVSVEALRAEHRAGVLPGR